MVYRFMYVGYECPGKPLTDAGDPAVLHLSLSRFGEMLFLYYEATAPDVAPERAVKGETKPFPDGSAWFWMPDVYHFSHPLSEEHWARRTQKTPWVRLNRLKREKYSSYIFNHYRFEEEQPGYPKADKYGIIGAYGDLLYMYLELPEEFETVPMEPTLSTKDTPSLIGDPSPWAQKMSGHFRPWEDTDEEWRPIENVFFR